MVLITGMINMKMMINLTKKIITFAYSKPKETAILLLLLLLGLLFLRLSHEKNKNHELTAKIDGMPKNTKQIVTVEKNKVIVKYKETPTKVEYIEKYLPPEGKVEVITKENEPNKPPEVKIKDWGFTARLGGGVVYSGKLEPVLDLKWFYWRRYGLTVGVTKNHVGIGITRHVDDLIGFKNIEIVCYINVGNNKTINLIGIRNSF